MITSGTIQAGNRISLGKGGHLVLSLFLLVTIWFAISILNDHLRGKAVSSKSRFHL